MTAKFKELYVSQLRLDVDGNQLFCDGLELEADVRTLAQMKKVLFDEKFAETADPQTPTYFMYRGVCKSPELELKDTRYDLTIIPSLSLGSEYNKTFGHYHTDARPGLTFPEVYEVLEGEAHYLLQKKEGSKLSEAKLIKARAGDVVIVPPNFGHVTINPGKDALVMANLVSTKFNSDYSEYESKQGAAYYELVGGKFLKNEHYEAPPSLKIEKAQSELRDILSVFLNEPEKFAFLNAPWKLK
ncbi:MAG: glucose-6-phosphate isomerase family protein [Candidatus Micrarchaeota archaeon]